MMTLDEQLAGRRHHARHHTGGLLRTAIRSLTDAATRPRRRG